jgi:RNA polymerase sigma-70 factor (ECF subfamily)
VKDLYQAYAPALVRKAERMLRRRDDALDVVHALFVDLLERGERPELPYLYRAITNRCLNVMRDGKNRERLLAAEAWPRATLSAEAQTLSMNALLKLVASLDDRRAGILVYYFLDDLTQEEMEAVTGLSRRTLGKYIEEIRQRLAALLEGSAP